MLCFGAKWCLIHCMKEGFRECCIRSYGGQRVMGYEATRSSASSPSDGVVLERKICLSSGDIRERVSQKSGQRAVWS